MRNTLKILLINAVNPYVEVETRYPSLGLAYLVSSVRKHLNKENIEFKIIDRDIAGAVKNFSPDLVGISSVTQNFGIAKKYAAYFTDMNIPVIMGGIHISCLPQTLPKAVLAAIIGEGEYSFTALVKAFLQGKPNYAVLNQIPGIAFWENGKSRFTEEDSPAKRDLNDIPLPARDLLPIKQHTYMFTSRGCPYRCVFCASARFWDKLRFFSAEYVVNEIETLIKNHNVTMISFFDDLFIADRARLEQILILLEKKHILGKVKFTCNCRANLVDKKLALILSRMGVVSANMGLESGDDEVLRFLKGGLINAENNRQAINILKDSGISVNGSFVIGSPQEDKKQIMRTYNFIRKSRMDLFDVYLLTPFPATPIWDYAKKRGIISDSMNDWQRLNMNAYSSASENIVCLSEILSKKELLAIYKKFLNLRFRRNLIKVIKHPMSADIPAMAYKLAKEFIYNLFKKFFHDKTK